MRLSEWVLGAYFTYVTALAVALPVQAGLRVRMLVVNGFLLGCYAVLLQPRFRAADVAEHLRNWIPLALMLLAYREVGWLAPAAHDHRLELSWIVWDRMALREWRLRDAIESTGPIFPTILETCYLL